MLTVAAFKGPLNTVRPVPVSASLSGVLESTRFDNLLSELKRMSAQGKKSASAEEGNLASHEVCPLTTLPEDGKSPACAPMSEPLAFFASKSWTGNLTESSAGPLSEGVQPCVRALPPLTVQGMPLLNFRELPYSSDEETALILKALAPAGGMVLRNVSENASQGAQNQTPLNSSLPLLSLCPLNPWLRLSLSVRLRRTGLKDKALSRRFKRRDENREDPDALVW